MSFNFMAAVTICSDFGAPQIKSDTVSTVYPSISHEVMGPDATVFKLCTLKRKTDKIDAIVLHSYDSFTNKNGILRNLWETKN